MSLIEGVASLDGAGAQIWGPREVCVKRARAHPTARYVCEPSRQERAGPR